ncbi:hypothetical protein Tco_1515966 [Tanacetum coccineum]
MVKMVPHEAFACRCAEEDVVLRQTYKPESYASETLWMWIFLWKETRLRKLMSSPGAPSTPSYSAGHSTPPIYSLGPSTPPSYSSGPSTPTNYSLGSSRNAECSKLQALARKDKSVSRQQWTCICIRNNTQLIRLYYFTKFSMKWKNLIWSSLSCAM